MKNNTSHDFEKRIDQATETTYGPSMAWIDVSSRFALQKIARAAGLSEVYMPPKLAQVIETIRGRLPRDKVAFYNRALGDFETYGINKNGDGWERHWLQRKHATFIRDAEYYHNHANKRGVDPGFGRPIASAFNDKTNMVDLIIVADMDKQASEDVQTLESGGQVFTSMGCRVKYDTCLICEHKASHPGEYCEHVSKTASWPYGMGQILSDGRVCGVLNPDPVFFDISRVRNPAFVGSEHLMKVAAASSVRVRATAPVRATRATGATRPTRASKTADMVKRLPAKTELALVGERVVGRYSRAAPKVPVEQLMKEAGTFSAAIRGALALGVILSPSEYHEAIEIGTGRKHASVAWPSRAEILDAEVDAQTLVSFSMPAPSLSSLDGILEDRSILQPVLFNRLQSLKVASTVPDHQPRSLLTGSDLGYASYRAACLRFLDGNFLGVDTEKVADTLVRTTSDLSREVALGAWTKEFSGIILEKTAQVVDTGQALFVSGPMLEDFGVHTLDQMAQNSLT